MRSGWSAALAATAVCLAVWAEDVAAPPEFKVTLPEAKTAFPAPLAKEHSSPGFRIRGTKGWRWFPEQYQAEIPFLAQVQMNFLMNCYTSMFDIENHPDWAKDQANRWWEPLPEEKKTAYEQVIKACQAKGIEFCFAMNPNLASTRPLDYRSDKDFEDLLQHYTWAQSVGVKWFSVCLDDITTGIDAKGQASVVNFLFAQLRRKDSEAQMVFCPTYYSGRGESTEAEAYLDELAKALEPEIYCFWTGDSVVGPITASAAQAYKDRIGHKLFLWDNYPVNDNQPTMHLGPVRDREPELADIVDGYVSNPHCAESDMNRVPLATCADFAYNPWSYDPDRSIGQAILHIAEKPAQQEVLKDLVELYPGMLACAKPSTGYNAMLERFKALLQKPETQADAQALLARAEDVSKRLAKAFPGQYRGARRTLETNIGTMRAGLREKTAEAKP